MTDSPPRNHHNSHLEDMLRSQRTAFLEGVLILPRPQLATLDVVGPEAVSWLDGMLTNKIKGMQDGEATLALSTSQTGKLNACVWVAVNATGAQLGVCRDVAASLLESLDRHLIMEDAELTLLPDSSAPTWWFGFGPKTAELAKVLRAQAIPVAEGTRDGVPYLAALAPPAQRVAFSEIITAPAGVVLATPRAWTAIRIDYLWPERGVDFELGGYPQEASLERAAVSFNKGCYLGQEAVFMLEKRGRANKRLVVVEANSVAAPELVSGQELKLGDKVVGTIKSACRLDGTPTAIALVKHTGYEEGSLLTLADGSGEVRVRAPRSATAS